MSFQVSVLANNISSDQGEFCIVPNIETTDQNDFGIHFDSPKEIFVTNSEARNTIKNEVCPTKVLVAKRSSMP